MVIIDGDNQPEASQSPEKKRLRSPNGTNVKEFLRGYGIQLLPYEKAYFGGGERPENVIYGGRTVSRLMRKDIDKTALVIRCIQVSNPRCFEDVCLWSVWSVLTAHFGHMRGVDAISSFRLVDIGKIKKRAHRLAVGETGRMSKTWNVIATLLADELIEKGAE